MCSTKKKLEQGAPMTLMQRLKRKLFPPREVIEGYESEELVETIFHKTIAYDPSGDWPLVAGVNSVLDFGGGAGLHYKLARKQSPDIRWAWWKRRLWRAAPGN